MLVLTFTYTLCADVLQSLALDTPESLFHSLSDSIRQSMGGISGALDQISLTMMATYLVNAVLIFMLEEARRMCTS